MKIVNQIKTLIINSDKYDIGIHEFDIVAFDIRNERERLVLGTYPLEEQVQLEFDTIVSCMKQGMPVYQMSPVFP